MSNGLVLWQQALPIYLKDTIETNENLVSKGWENKRKAGARKAGAAPGTTAGVEPVPFPGLQTPKTVRKALWPQAFGLRAL